MKIAYIGIKGLPARAGADRVVEAIVQRLAPRHELTVYCSPAAVPPEAGFPGVELMRMPALPGKHLHAPSLFLASALHALTRRHFDLVHVHNVEACFVLPLLKARYRVMATSHGQAYARDKWGRAAKTLIRVADWPYIRLADCVTSVSKPLADYYQGCYHRSVHYIPNGVSLQEGDIDLTAARDLLGSLEVRPGEYVLFAAGRIIPTKGAHLLLEAFGSLDTELRLLVVGDASHLPAYREKLHQLADPRAAFVPPLDRNELLGLVRLARLFVFPSTVEAMSMMLLEAASVGTPLVSSDISPNRAILPQQALFFRSGDADDLREKLEWALGHPDEMGQMGSGAREWVMSNYHWDAIVDRYEQLYRRVARGNDGVPGQAA